MAGGAQGISCTIERRPALSINPTTCLRARRLIGAINFLWPDGPTTSSLFLFAKTEEGALGVTSTMTTTGPASPAGWPHSPIVDVAADDGMVPLADPTCFTSDLQAKSRIIPTKQERQQHKQVLAIVRHRPQTQKRARLGTLPPKAASELLTKERERMARTSSEADNYSQISLSTLSTRVNRSSSYDLNLVGSNYQ